MNSGVISANSDDYPGSPIEQQASPMENFRCDKNTLNVEKPAPVDYSEHQEKVYVAQAQVPPVKDEVVAVQVTSVFPSSIKFLLWLIALIFLLLVLWFGLKKQYHHRRH